MKSNRNTRTRFMVFAVTACITLMTGQSIAHNNAVIHPDITLRATALLAATSPGLYDEMTRFQGILRPLTRVHGVNITTSMQAAVYSDAALYEAGPEDNIVSGVVLEDDPVQRVLEHFYHARSGVPLSSTARSSRTRARELFHQSIALYGDSVQAKEQAYFHLGRASHHVEDMSSPAHVHNDAHLVTNAQTDDYEARWLPLQVWNREFAAFNSYLNMATSVPDRSGDSSPISRVRGTD